MTLWAVQQAKNGQRPRHALRETQVLARMLFFYEKDFNMSIRHTAISATFGAVFIVAVGCREGTSLPRDYRQDMRDFVQTLSAYARATKPDFLIVPQNGQQLLTQNGEADGPLSAAYIAAISGVGREDLFYGYAADDVPTPANETACMVGFLDLAERNALEALVIDYCRTPSCVNASYARNAARGYISFAADQRELTGIPPYPPAPFGENAGDVASLTEARNFLYLLNSQQFVSRAAYLDRLRSTNYDLLIIDLAFQGTAELTPSEVNSLKVKANGGKRLVLCYISIGEAEDYRYYWQEA